MSDTFGATGLDADMPGLGPQSGNVRGPPVQLPSALQGLAQHALGQGRPQFPPPPGQGGHRGKPPQLGSTDGPPDQTARSFAPVPANAPRPPPRFTPYLQPPPRDSNQWGQQEPFPRLPQSFELLGMYHQLGGYFAQHGGFASAPMGAGMAAYSKAYQDAFQKGQDWKMRMAKEQVAMHAAQLEDLERTRSVEYADTFAEYNALDGGDINGVSLHDALWKTAVEHGDKDVIAMLEGGASAEQVRRFLAQHESNIRALGAANKKSEEGDAESALWGLKPDPSGDTQTNPYGAPTAQSGDRGEPSGDRGEPQSGESLIHTGAVKIFKGYEPGGYVPPKVKNAMALEAADMDRRTDAILSDPNIKPDQIIPEVRKQLGPDVASDLEGYSQYRSGPGATGQSSGGKEQDYWSKLGSLAERARPGDPAHGLPGWSKSTYQAVRDFREEAQKPNSPIQRIPTSVEAANNVRADLAAIQGRDGSTADVSPENLSGLAGKDPLYAQLKIDWIRYNEDIDVLTRGTPSVGMAEQAINTMPQIPYFGSIAGYRAAVRRDMDQAKSRVDQLHNTWSQYQTGDIMPGFNPRAEQDMDGIRKMDFQTGALPGQVVTHPDGTKFRYLGVNPEDPGDRSNWDIVK